MSVAPKVIYFDVGKVLLTFSHERMCQQMADVSGVSPEAVRAAVFGNDDAEALHWRYEVGKLDTAGYYEHFCAEVGARPDRRLLEGACCDIFEPITPTWEIVRSLAAAGNRLALLSNINALHWDHLSGGKFDVLRGAGGPSSPFEWAILSYEVGAMKPSPLIYRAAIEQAGVPAEQIFFTDDRPENVDGARLAGIDAVLFEDTATLIDDLRARGVAGV